MHAAYETRTNLHVSTCFIEVISNSLILQFCFRLRACVESPCLLIYVCPVIIVIIRDRRFKSYYFLFFGRFVRTRSGAPSFWMWKFLDLRIQEMTTIFKKMCF